MTHCFSHVGALVLFGSLVGTVTVPAQQAAPPVVAPPLASPAAPLAIQAVTVIDVETGRHIPNQTVVIAERRIQAITSDTARLPNGAHLVDGRGKYLIPGLWDMHTHVAYMGTGLLLALLANGQTGIRDIGLNGGGGSLEKLLQWRREIAAGALVGPRMVVTGIMIDTFDVEGRTRAVRTPADAKYVVDSLKAAGADFIKLHSSDMSREVYFAIAAESRRVGIPFVGHLPTAITVVEASDSGQRSIEHGTDMRSPCSEPLGSPANWPEKSETACAALVARFRRNGTWVTPTIKIIADYAPLVGDNAGEDAKRLAHESYRVGVPMLAGTDLTARPALDEELKLMVEAGMSPLDVLRTATLNPAKFFGATDSLGTIAAGKVADLVLLDADPLQAIENTARIRAVIADGRYFDRAALDGLLVTAERVNLAAHPDMTEASP